MDNLNQNNNLSLGRWLDEDDLQAKYGASYNSKYHDQRLRYHGQYVFTEEHRDRLIAEKQARLHPKNKSWDPDGVKANVKGLNSK